MAERVLPHNLEAEKCVLGAILIDNPSFNQAAEVIDAHDFFRDAHRRIFEKMIALSDRSQPILNCSRLASAELLTRMRTAALASESAVSPTGCKAALPVCRGFNSSTDNSTSFGHS